MKYKGPARVAVFGARDDTRVPFLVARGRVMLGQIEAARMGDPHVGVVAREWEAEDGSRVRVAWSPWIKQVWVAPTPPAQPGLPPPPGLLEPELPVEEFEYFDRCYNGLVLDERPEGVSALLGTLYVADQGDLLPEDVGGFVTASSVSEIGTKLWLRPLTSRLAKNTVLDEVNYLSGRNLVMCRDERAWYWEHDGYLWRVEARMTQPMLIGNAEPELTDNNTLPVNDTISFPPSMLNMPRGDNVNPLPPGWMGTGGSPGDFIVGNPYQTRGVVESLAWKVGVLLREYPVRKVDENAAGQEEIERTAWLRFPPDSKSFFVAQAGEDEERTCIWGSLVLSHVDSGSAVFYLLGVEGNPRVVTSTTWGHSAVSSRYNGQVSLNSVDLTHSLTPAYSFYSGNNLDGRGTIDDSVVGSVLVTDKQDSIVSTPDDDHWIMTRTSVLSFVEVGYPDSDDNSFLEGFAFPDAGLGSKGHWEYFLEIPSHTRQGSITHVDALVDGVQYKVVEDWEFTYSKVRTTDTPASTVESTITYRDTQEGSETGTVQSVSLGQELSGVVGYRESVQFTSTFTVTVGAVVHQIVASEHFTEDGEAEYTIRHRNPNTGQLPRDLTMYVQTAPKSLRGEVITSIADESKSLAATQTLQSNLVRGSTSAAYPAHGDDRFDQDDIAYRSSSVHRTKEPGPGASLVDSVPRVTFPPGSILTYVLRNGCIVVSVAAKVRVDRAGEAANLAVCYVVTDAGHVVKLHPSAPAITEEAAGGFSYNNMRPLDHTEDEAALPVDFSYNPETQQLYLRYADDPQGCFIHKANLPSTVKKLPPGVIGPIRRRKP